MVTVMVQYGCEQSASPYLLLRVKIKADTKILN